MKRVVLLMTVLALSLVCLSSCQKGKGKELVLYDFVPSYIEIAVVDGNGNNLIDPAYDGNILGNVLQLEYDGKTYELQKDDSRHYGDNAEDSDISTRAILGVKFRGLMTNTKDNTLKIGYFDQDVDRAYEEYCILWGDGTASKIGYEQNMEWVYDEKEDSEKPVFHARYWLDGKEITDAEPFGKPQITVVYERSGD